MATYKAKCKHKGCDSYAYYYPGPHVLEMLLNKGTVGKEKNPSDEIVSLVCDGEEEHLYDYNFPSEFKEEKE